jgi:hypothetical protein
MCKERKSRIERKDAMNDRLEMELVIHDDVEDKDEAYLDELRLFTGKTNQAAMLNAWDLSPVYVEGRWCEGDDSTRTYIFSREILRPR